MVEKGAAVFAEGLQELRGLLGRRRTDVGELAAGSISNPITHCYVQAVTFEKEVPRFGVTWELAGW